MEKMVDQIERLVEKAATCVEAKQAQAYATAAHSSAQAAVLVAGLRAHLDIPLKPAA